MSRMRPVGFIGNDGVIAAANKSFELDMTYSLEGDATLQLRASNGIPSGRQVSNCGGSKICTELGPTQTRLKLAARVRYLVKSERPATRRKTEGHKSFDKAKRRSSRAPRWDRVLAAVAAKVRPFCSMATLSSDHADLESRCRRKRRRQNVACSTIPLGHPGATG